MAHCMTTGYCMQPVACTSGLWNCVICKASEHVQSDGCGVTWSNLVLKNCCVYSSLGQQLPFGWVFVYWFSVSKQCWNIVGHRKEGWAKLCPGSCPPARQEIRSIFAKISIILDKNRAYFLTGNDGNQKLARIVLKGQARAGLKLLLRHQQRDSWKQHASPSYLLGFLFYS